MNSDPRTGQAGVVTASRARPRRLVAKTGAPVTGILDTIGHTPLVHLKRLWPEIECALFAKLEGFNPGGSVKDRPALALLQDAMRAGRIREGSLVVESSSGNMGVGLAIACRVLRMRFTCVVDPRTTDANVKLLRAYGATVEIVEKPDPKTGDYLDARMERVQRILDRNPGAYWTDQYRNPANPREHSESTAVELIDDLGGPPEAVLVPTSTCGTFVGIRTHLRAIGAATRVVAVDAEGSVIFGQARGRRAIPGLGSAQPAPLIDPDGVDVIHVSAADCVAGCRLLAAREAILVGGSSGGVIIAARRVASSIGPSGRIAMILPDRGDRYLDTIFSDDWVSQNVGSLATVMAGL